MNKRSLALFACLLACTALMPSCARKGNMPAETPAPVTLHLSDLMDSNDTLHVTRCLDNAQKDLTGKQAQELLSAFEGVILTPVVPKPTPAPGSTIYGLGLRNANGKTVVYISLENGAHMSVLCPFLESGVNYSLAPATGERLTNTFEELFADVPFPTPHS